MFHLAKLKSNGCFTEENPKKDLERALIKRIEILDEEKQNDFAPALTISSRGLRFWKRRRRNKTIAFKKEEEEDAQRDG
jgi:hypothetical protein